MIENLRTEYFENELTIGDLYELFHTEESAFTSDGHEMIDVEDLHVLGYTSDVYKKGNIDHLPVKRLIRHKVSKGMWELITTDCDGNDISIITTEDHGLIAWVDGDLIRLAPNEFLDAEYDTVVINDDGIPHISEVKTLRKIGDFEDEYVYDIEMENNPHTFFANDILIHNSIYITMRPLYDHLGIKLTESEERIVGTPMKLTEDAMKIITELGGEGNPKDGIITRHLDKWALSEMNSVDPRFIFAREKICKRGIFMNAKKRYVIQVIDSDGIPIPVGGSKEFSYTGIDGIVTATHSKEVQNLLKDVVKLMIITNDMDISNDAVKIAYNKFTALPPETLATRKSMKNLKKYEKNADGFLIGKGTPQNSKASLIYNNLIDHLTLGKDYEKIKSGDKIKILYVAKNRFGIEYVGFKDILPCEFDMTPNYNLLYKKQVHPVIERIFIAVSWSIIDPTKNYVCDVLSEFS